MTTQTIEMDPGITPSRLTMCQARLMAVAGSFQDARVELIGGHLHAMTMNPPHVSSVLQLDRSQPARFGRRWLPQPDLTIEPGRLPVRDFLP